MIFRDRLVAGFTAGAVGGIAMNVFAQIAWFLHLTQVRYLDWAAVLLYGHRPHGFGEAAFAQIVQIVFTGILGIAFAYLVPLISSRHYLFRGIVFGLTAWFLIYSMTLLYGLHTVVQLELLTVAVDFVGSVVFGLVLAATLNALEEKIDDPKSKI
ncbi:MAG: YqhR family membrane protein [Bacillota bacterium]